MRVLLAAIAAAFASVAPSHPPAGPPPYRVAQALCVHAGLHYSPTRQWRGERPEYVLWGHGYYRAHRYDDDVSGPGPNGEGAWDADSDPRYGGGMSFTIGTWNSAGPYASSTSAIAHAPPAEQIRRTLVVVARDGDWSEWPDTSASCGF